MDKLFERDLKAMDDYRYYLKNRPYEKVQKKVQRRDL